MPDIQDLLDEGTIPIPPFNASNFFQASRMFFQLWITEQTKHRLFKWYLGMLDYIAQNEADYGTVPDVATEPEITSTES